FPWEKRGNLSAMLIYLSGMKDPETCVGARLTEKAFCDIID
ncbi:MAG: NADPH-dependent FMN reductase, partial [Methanoregula sp.]